MPVAEALARVLDGATPLPAEATPLLDAHGRVLAADLAAKRTQPPDDVSAMDGYAVRADDVATHPAKLKVIGEVAAGHPFDGKVGPGQAARIFTGGVLPPGADTIVIQENTTRDGNTVTVTGGSAPKGRHIRVAGLDFQPGAVLLAKGTRLTARDLALAAAMNHPTVPVHRMPKVAVLATGDELVEPGGSLGPGQIIASNHLGVAALAEATGAEARLLGIARDTRKSLDDHIAKAAAADILVTIGGASVGDHDLVGPVLADRGMALSFWKIAMRPGKPLMYGRLGASRVLGLPGNPVSALVCSRVFLVPLIQALLGRPDREQGLRQARAAVALEMNGPRTHYMRATSIPGADGVAEVTPVRSQDSSLLAPLAEADCLLVRPANAPAALPGALVGILPLDF